MTQQMISQSIRNSTEKPLLVVLEPWAEEVNLAPNKELRVDIFFQKSDLMTVDFHEGLVSIWLWGGCTAKIWFDGKDITPDTLSIPSV